MKVFFWSIAILLTFFQSIAQQSRPYNSVQIYEKIKQLNHLTTIMYLAAHPDDENTRLLSYLTHERNFKTVYLSLTRGDGGQNLIGTELGIELGLIRNYELIAARQIDGASQAFTSVIDFGYSKNPEETFSFWNQQALVNEVKEAIKIYRPDIIICRFPTTGEGGHGQHTASAIVAVDAYNQLEQEQYLHLPERVLFNAFQFGNRSTIKESQVKIETNQYNYLLGESYGEMAGRSRSIHRSQGAGTPQSYGRNFEHFEVIAGGDMHTDFVDKDYTWNRVEAPQITKSIDKLLQQYDFSNPAASIKDLLAIRIQIAKVKDDYWRETKLQELDDILRSAMGVMAECYYNKAEVIAGADLDLTLKMIVRADGVQLHSLTIPGNAASLIPTATTLANDRTFEKSIKIKVDPTLPITQPYWLAQHPTNANYVYTKYHTLPETPNQFVATATLEIDGTILTLDIPISYKYLSPTKGDVVQPLRIVPEVLVQPAEALVFFHAHQGSAMKVWLKTNSAAIHQGILSLYDLNKGKRILVKEMPVTLPSLSKDSMYTFLLSQSDLEKILTDQMLLTFTAPNGKEYKHAQRLINYDHLPELVYYPEARLQMVAQKWAAPTAKVGYINGAGDKVFDILKQIGVDISIIPDEALGNSELLHSYDAIVVGVRAYNANELLSKNKDAMMAFVNKGGNLIVQYNTSMNLLTKDLGPYPFTLGRSRVTDEHALITVTNPQSPLLLKPNVINTNDYQEWVQERGLYFAEDLDPRYQTIFAMHDKGEKPLNNALFYGKYGKGHYIYTSLSFFRQLPAGNAGAIKLFMNMIAL